MADENLDWLMNWYVRECNNGWMHSYGVRIDTLGNPGWTIEIDLGETSLEGRSFEPKHGEPAGDLDEWRKLGSWWTAEVDGVRFKAACGATDLPAVIGVCREWAVSHRQ